MEAIVHIGRHKTGTTSIQAWIGRNRARLAEAGICCEDFLTTRGRIDHFGFALAPAAPLSGQVRPPPQILAQHGIHGPAAIAPAARRFEADLDALLARRPAPVYLVSSESIGGWFRRPEAIASLDGWFRARFETVRYVAYIRRQDDFVTSLYFQMLKAGATETLAAFACRNARQSHLDFARAWREAVGRERFDLRLLEPDWLCGGDLIADFAAAAGIDPEGFAPAPRANAAMRAGAAHALRGINRVPGLRDLPPARKVRLAGLVDRGPKLRLGAAAAAEVRAANAAENETLRREFFPDRAILFPGDPPAGTPATPGEGA